MKLIIIIILVVVVLIEAYIILVKEEEARLKRINLEDKLNDMYKRHQDISEQRDKWQSAYVKEKRMSDHRARRIESIYRGQMIKANKENNGVKDNIS